MVVITPATIIQQFTFLGISGHCEEGGARSGITGELMEKD